MKPSTPTNGGVTLRAALIGTLFIPMNVYLVVQWETVWGTQYPTTMSIFFNAIFSLFILSILNFGLRRAFPRNAPSQGEMLTVYVVMITAVAVSGHDFTQTVFCTLGTASWYATPENEWNVLFGRHVPTWLTVNDPAILTPFYEGDATVLDARQLRGWALPVVAWTVFFTAFAFTALCLNVLVRRQWMEHEKLTYPLTQLPFEMTQENPLAFYMRPALWVGFGIGAGLDVLNGLSFLYPTVPNIPMLIDMTQSFTEKPWSAVGNVWIQFNPYVIGLAFAIPLDLLFSSWFFYLIWKAERVFGAASGVNVPGYPFENQQLLGGYLAIGLVLLWTGRRFFVPIATKALRFRRDSEDDDEPMTFRFAFWGGIAGLLFLVGFMVKAGMAVWFALFFFAAYYAVLFAFTRLRAEVGPPLLGISHSGPIQFAVALFGSRTIPLRSMTVAAPLMTGTKEIRNNPMPFQLESFKLAQRAGMDTRRLWKVILWATFIAVPITFFAFLQASYEHGGVGGWRGLGSYTTIERWALRREGIDTTFRAVMGVGAAVVFANTALRLRFLSWPLHPLGYLLAGYYHMDRLWVPFFFAWAIKRLILQFGGIRGYRRALPLFLGMVLGEFVVGSAWGLIGLATGTRTYAFKAW